DLQTIDGAGAAGGLGGALAGVLQGEMKSGFQVIADLVEFESAVKEADLVLTGEGRLDGQSAQGKVPVEVGKIAYKHGVPAVAVAGEVAQEGIYAPLTSVFSIQTGPCSLEEALDENISYANIRHVSEQIVRLRLK
ncbi:glycerate kinase, partial [Halobacillus sp. BBL2006]|uniref:glycerate kinase n=1 Tax=Halobacillus sp. BBL2006 TaxID=1543706 RepID=UPI0005443C30